PVAGRPRPRRPAEPGEPGRRGTLNSKADASPGPTNRPRKLLSQHSQQPPHSCYDERVRINAAPPTPRPNRPATRPAPATPVAASPSLPPSTAPDSAAAASSPSAASPSPSEASASSATTSTDGAGSSGSSPSVTPLTYSSIQACSPSSHDWIDLKNR